VWEKIEVGGVGKWPIHYMISASDTHLGGLQGREMLGEMLGDMRHTAIPHRKTCLQSSRENQILVPPRGSQGEIQASAIDEGAHSPIRSSTCVLFCVPSCWLSADAITHVVRPVTRCKAM
jgi:hypothetical protein